MFVGALSYNVTASELKDKFSVCGTIVNVYIKDGYAFVEYDNQDSVN